jgi:hypothetical protein
MSLKFYFDKHISKRAAIQLGNQGVDVVHCDDVGLAAASDPEHLEYATNDNRAVVTHDDDFLKLHDEWTALGKEHGGIFFLLSHTEGKIGVLVRELYVYYEMIEGEAGTIEDDIQSQRIFIG